MEKYAKTLTTAFDPMVLFQTFLTNLLLLLSLGLFSKSKLGPALIVLAVYVVTWVANKRARHGSLTAQRVLLDPRRPAEE